MSRVLLSVALACTLLAGAVASAQTGNGSLVGYVKDEQGGVLPGVTVTAKGPELLRPVITVSDATGYYRLLNLPPGTYTVTAAGKSSKSSVRKPALTSRSCLMTSRISMRRSLPSSTL